MFATVLKGAPLGNKNAAGTHKKHTTSDTPGAPLKGHAYHSKTNDELKYIMQDAGEAAKAMKDHDPKAESKYLDQVNDASTVLAHRKRKGISDVERPSPSISAKIDTHVFDSALGL